MCDDFRSSGVKFMARLAQDLNSRVRLGGCWPRKCLSFNDLRSCAERGFAPGVKEESEDLEA